MMIIIIIFQTTTTVYCNEKITPFVNLNKKRIVYIILLSMSHDIAKEHKPCDFSFTYTDRYIFLNNK